MQHRVKTTSVKTWLVWSHAWSYNITCFSFKLRSNGQQKRAIYFATLLQNALKSDVARITTYLQACLVTNQVVASCVNSDFWLDKLRGTRTIHRSYVTSRKSSLPYAGKTFNMYRVCWKSRTTHYFLQPLFATCSNPICFRTGLVWVVKRATSLINSLCGNVAKQVARFRSPFYRTFRSNTISHRFLKLQINPSFFKGNMSSKITILIGQNKQCL